MNWLFTLVKNATLDEHVKIVSSPVPHNEKTVIRDSNVIVQFTEGNII